MIKYSFYVKCILLVSCLILTVAGCSTKKSNRMENMGHAELLQKGLEQVKKGNMAQALMSLQLVKDRYPYTESAVIASLKLADTYFDMGEYTTAFDLYYEFEKLHPKDSNIPYIQYQKGMCSYKQIRGFDREQTHAVKAKIDFGRLINQYPDSEYSIKARRYYRECLLNLSRFEIFTANFYFKQKKYFSALERYKYAVKYFPDLGQYHEALEKIGICKLKLAALDKETPAE